MESSLIAIRIARLRKSGDVRSLRRDAEGNTACRLSLNKIDNNNYDKILGEYKCGFKRGIRLMCATNASSGLKVDAMLYER